MNNKINSESLREVSQLNSFFLQTLLVTTNVRFAGELLFAHTELEITSRSFS